MNDSMFGWCSTGRNGVHDRRAIGYEKITEGPKYENRGTSLAITEAAYYRYFVVWVCQSCAKTWWVEDHPQIAAASA